MDSRFEPESPRADLDPQTTPGSPGTNEPDYGINARIDRFFLRLIAGLAVVAGLAGISYAASYHGAKEATAGTAAAGKPQATMVTVAMHDPGCHWFKVGQQLEKSLSVSGPVKLQNGDEAALRVSTKGATPTVVPVGQTADVPSGAYAITMVGQAPDDNTLNLQVN